MDGVVQAFPVIDTTGRQVMQTPEDVAQMLRLKAAGLSIKHVARQMGCSKNTVRRYLRGGGWVAYKRPERRRTLRGLEAVAWRATAAASRQRGRRAPGSGTRARHQSVAAHRGAGGGAVAPRAARRGGGYDPV